eukprot:3511772-Alexandrium_andersonii.AAC.1
MARRRSGGQMAGRRAPGPRRRKRWRLADAQDRPAPQGAARRAKADGCATLRTPPARRAGAPRRPRSPR